MQKWIRPAAVALLGVLACSDGAAPTAPGSGHPNIDIAPTERAAIREERGRMERLAQRLARGLADPQFRAYVKAQLDRSPFPEHKVQFQRFVAASGGRALRALAAGGTELALTTTSAAADSAAVDAEVRGTMAVELYFPFPAHRAAWNGDANVMVATLINDDDTPVAFDTKGRRTLLDPTKEPATPTLVLVPVETDFDRMAVAQATMPACYGGCGEEPNPGGGSSGPGTGSGTPSTGSTAPSGGLYMTRVHFNSDYEGAFKGSPEFEIHILGQYGSSDSLTTYQCIAAGAVGPYTWDMNSKDWTGNVLLFSQRQLNDYKAQHPDHNFRIFALEDDDTACQIRFDDDRFNNLARELNAAYSYRTGARDSLSGITKTLRDAKTIEKLLRSLYSFFKSHDDQIGNAIEDDVAAEFIPGANWLVKGENRVTNGYLNLEMH